MMYDFEVNPKLVRCFPGMEGLTFLNNWRPEDVTPRLFGTVQAALDAAEGREHTTILVRKGTYIEEC